MTTTNHDPSSAANPGGSKDPNAGNLTQLVDNLRNIENKDDEIVAILTNNWQKLVGALAVLLLVTWLGGRYREAQHTRGGEASSNFAILQESFNKIASATNPADATNAFQTNLRSLSENYSSSVYAKLGQLYAAKADFTAGNSDAALARLKNFSPETAVRARTGSAVLTETEFLAELAALLKARIQLARESDREEARKTLKALAENADAVAVEALLSFIRSARTDAERKDAEDFRNLLVLKRPTLAGLINRETKPANGPFSGDASQAAAAQAAAAQLMGGEAAEGDQ